MNTQYFKILGSMALEYRLSLDNLCKLLNLEITEENKMTIYNNIKKTTSGNVELIERYNYLFFEETIIESLGASKIAYMCALNFLRRYNKAKKEGNKEKEEEFYKELYRTENRFQEIKPKLGNEKLTVDDISVISKYRIKYVLSRERFCDNFGISWRNLIRREKEIESAILKNKINILSEYYASFNYRRKK